MTREDDRALRATLIDAAWAAHKQFAMGVHSTRELPLEAAGHLVQFHVDEAIDTISVTFKHLQLSLVARPVRVGPHAAMEYHLRWLRGDDTKDVATFYIVERYGRFYDNPEGLGESMGQVQNVRSLVTLGGWLSDKLEEAGVLSPRVHATGIFV